MSTKHKFEAGQVVGNFQILGQAESHGGHARWHLECRSCTSPTTARATDIRSHRIRCACQRGEPAVTASTVPMDGPTNEDVLRTLREMSDTLHKTLQEVQDLRAEVTQLRGQPAAPAKPAGIRTFAPMVKPHKPLTLQDILDERPNLTQDEALQQSMLDAYEIYKIDISPTGQATPEMKRTAVERAHVERAVIELIAHTNPDEYASRREVVDKILDRFEP